jgi:hypothetical protein
MVERILESAIERELRLRVEALGGLCIKVKAIGRRGFFDRIVVLPGGRVWFVELKRPKGGRLSPHQVWHLGEFSRLGAVAVVVKSTADIDRLLGS